MPRRSSRAAPGPAMSTSVASKSKRRRPSMSSADNSSCSPSRKEAQATARQSRFFGQGTDSDFSLDAESQTQTQSPSAESSDSTGPVAKRRRRGSKKPAAKRKGAVAKKQSRADDARDSSDHDTEILHGKELWREGVRTGLGPGKEVFIERPKMRDPGNVPYRDDALHPNTLLFLRDLAENNERQWFKVHDVEYRAAKKDWETYVESLSEKIIEKDSTIPELPVKDLVFRIHRDARFNKDPTPYKTHFAAAWSRTGKKGPYAAYYVHFEPGSCFVGSGIWMPDADRLAAMREEIDQRSDRLKAVLLRPDIRREIFGGISGDTEEVVKAFVDKNKENALKVKPKGYEVDNKNIQLLRLRSFTIGRAFTDSDMMDANSQEKIASTIGVMEPFVTYINSVVMPDPARDTDSEPASG